jgi:putative ABC transport system permease protein
VSGGVVTAAPPVRARRGPAWATYAADLQQGFGNLLLHKLRSFLTMLGMIFGVAAVVSMLSIGAGAKRQVMAFIEQLGVRNLIVEAREAVDGPTLQRVRRLSPGLTLADFRIIGANLDAIEQASPRKRVTPTKMIPRPERDMPVVVGVSESYARIANLAVAAGRFFDASEDEQAAPVCVLGEEARANLFGPRDAVGEYVKVNEQWLRVVGTVAPQLTLDPGAGGPAGLASQDRNNQVYVPLNSALLRLEDSQQWLKDEIDGIYVQLRPGEDSLAAARVVRGVLDATHRNASDFSIVVPAELLAQEQRTGRIFDMVMVALASISLLVGGIGIMNIMLASILERTREIGVRRALGARQKDIIRQFLTEATLISVLGGFLGILFGFGMSRVIAWLAGWSTIVTVGSILLAFLVSVSVGLIFGIFPATKAARLDPVEAIRYE